MSNQTRRLFTPIRIGSLELKNRIVMAPMGTRYPSFNGYVTQRFIDYYVERARGGVGLIIVHFASIARDGISSQYPLGIWDDCFVPGLRQLVDAVHAAGAKVAIQLAHAGGQTSYAFTRLPLVAPSAVPCVGRETPRELTLEQIAAVSDAFWQAARRTEEAGFDAVELHMAHGYLLNQFLSPLFNRRTDAYGGDLANRARLPLEVLRGVRAITGNRLPILCRLNADDGVPASLELPEACAVAAMLEQAGAAVIDVSAGVGESFGLSVPSMCDAPGGLVHYAAAVKKVVKVPVVAVGKLQDPLIAEAVLAEGKADLIAIGRGLIADPDWALKAAEGRFDEIRPCLTCNRPECHGRTLKQLNMGCVVNAAVGREAMFRFSSAPKPRSILVAGGGAAALEFARAASLRGHRVTICEQAATLGGQLALAAAPPNKSDIQRLSDYLTGQVRRLGVDVRLGCKVTPELVAELKPDAVVVATGGRPLVPGIPGRELSVTAWDVLAGRAAVGKDVVVVGGGDVGCETAEYLAARGSRVTIVEMLPDVATELAAWTRRKLLDRLMKAGVEILTQTKVVNIRPGRVAYDRGGMGGELAPVESVVMACGVMPHGELAEALRGCGVPIHVIGDAAKPRNLADAIREGFELAFSL